MPNIEDKLFNLLCESEYMDWDKKVEYLIANGVTVQGKAEISDKFLEQLRNAPITILQEEPTIEVVREWISVKDRLPEDDDKVKFSDDGRMRFTTVLAYTEYGRTIPKNRLLVRPTGNEYLDKQVTDGWIWASGTEEVTHWMPLPEAPKGD